MAAWRHVWNQSYENQIIPCRGTAAGDRLYQGGQGLLELDVATGKELLNVNWTKQHPVYLESAPLLWQGKLYGILAEQKETEMTGVSLLYERLSCLDTATGRILWQSDEIGTGERPCGNPLLLNGKLYCGACFPIPESGKALTTDVHAAVGIWDAATGKLTGRIPLPKATYADLPLVSDGTSVYGNGTSCPSWKEELRSSLFRYDPATARVVWSLNYPTTPGGISYVNAALAVDGTTLAVVCRANDNNNRATAFDTTDGHVLWSKTGKIFSSSSSEQDPEIAMRSGIAFLTINDGTLIAMDERTGTQKWSLTIEKSPSPTPSKEGPPIYWYDRLIPMVTRDVLYIREGDSNLYAVNSETGTKLWQKTLLTKKEIWNESKELCDIIPVDSGIIIVTANSADLNPVIELWK